MAMVISSSFFRRSSSGRVSLAGVSLSELLLLLPSEEEGLELAHDSTFVSTIQ